METSSQPLREYPDSADVQPTIHALVRRWQLGCYLHRPAKLDESPPKRRQGRTAIRAEFHLVKVAAANHAMCRVPAAVSLHALDHVALPQPGIVLAAPLPPAREKGAAGYYPSRRPVTAHVWRFTGGLPVQREPAKCPTHTSESVTVSCWHERLSDCLSNCRHGLYVCAAGSSKRVFSMLTAWILVGNGCGPGDCQAGEKLF